MMQRNERIELRKEKKLTKEQIRARTKQSTRLAKQNKIVDTDWWKLDNAALIYPSSTSKSWPAAFRVSVHLKEDIKAGILQQAVDEIMPRFPYYNVRIRKGLFWYYFEELPFTPIVTKESKYPCRNFDINSRNHLIRVMYYNKKISFEAFHSVCDGKGAFKFFTTLLVRYFELQGIKIGEHDSFMNYLDLPRPEEVEDAFERYADFKEAAPRTKTLAYQIKGTPLERGKQLIYTALMDLNELKAAAKSHSASLTEYLLATIMFACKEQKRMLKVTKRPVGVQLTIDIRRFFPTETLRNFSSYKYIHLPEDFSGDLADIILYIRKEIAGINESYVMKNINANVKAQKNRAVRLLPIFIKDIALRLSARLFGERQVTTTFSNVGAIDAPEEFKGLADFYECLLGISRYNQFSITCCSYNGKVALAFTSKMVESDIFAKMFKSIANDNVKVELITNKGV